MFGNRGAEIGEGVCVTGLRMRDGENILFRRDNYEYNCKGNDLC